MAKTDPFSSPKRRLARAQQHISTLKKRIETFFKKNPPVRAAELDPDGWTVHCLKFARNMPESWSDAAGDALDALRSALDQCAYSAAVLGGATTPQNAYFPFADTAVNIENTIARRCKDLRPEVITLFRGFKPYKGGNDALWSLNKLCNANKHRLLIPVGITASGMTINHATASGSGSILDPKWNGEKNRIEFARFGPGSDFKYDVNLAFDIVFDQINGVESLPAGPALVVIARNVKDVLTQTEALCRTIGLLK